MKCPKCGKDHWFETNGNRKRCMICGWDYILVTMNEYTNLKSACKRYMKRR